MVSLGKVWVSTTAINRVNFCLCCVFFSVLFLFKKLNFMHLRWGGPPPYPPEKKDRKKLRFIFYSYFNKKKINFTESAAYYNYINDKLYLSVQLHKSIYTCIRMKYFIRLYIMDNSIVYRSNWDFFLWIRHIYLLSIFNLDNYN